MQEDIRRLKNRIGDTGPSVPPWAVWAGNGGFQGGGVGSPLGGGAYYPRYFPGNSGWFLGDLLQSGGFAHASHLGLSIIDDSPYPDYADAIKLPDGAGTWLMDTYVQIYLRAGPGDITITGGDPYWLELSFAANRGQSNGWAAWVDDTHRVVWPKIFDNPESGVFRWAGHYTNMWVSTGVDADEPNIASWAIEDLNLYAQDWTPLTAEWNVYYSDALYLGSPNPYLGTPAGYFRNVIRQV